ncbi:hypothetical protein CSC94_21805 [Zhengella mangrovi]|uniref:Uncharacterized protein n=1 Tax=Zhengella mangrovi TaxID=1982044 RepID=A0A2G1QHN7_9HYPH|nr:hypothetical protein [Zhengella mangrovi]PHP64971.1 hypothetical protein CSC94_21805 [Zhengella mangrovi]
MRPTSKIIVDEIAPRRTRIAISYRTPAWSRAMAASAHGLRNLIWLAGSVLAIRAAYVGQIEMTWPKQMVVVTLASTGAYVVGEALRQSLIWFWERGHGPHVAVVADITPDRIVVEDGNRTVVLDRVDSLTVTALPHRMGRREERDERRKDPDIGYAYRDAFEVWLQMGHRFERLASVASEADARAIVRHVQEADARAVRTAQQQDALHRRAPVF